MNAPIHPDYATANPFPVRPPKILFVGWGRCGKDEAGRFFNDELGIPYAGSTSWAALPLMAERLNTHPQLAWEHRHKNRQLWKDACDEFRQNDPLLLMKLALSTPLPCGVCGSVVTGVRDKREIVAAPELFPFIVWIDRPGIAPDPTVTFGPGDANHYVKNDGDLRRFHRNLFAWANSVRIGTVPTDYACQLLLDPSLNP